MYLVVGATGILGSEICRQLAAQGKPVRGLVRATSDQAKVDKLKSHGVEIVQGDMCDPASLEAACQGVSAVISTVSALPFCYEAGENDIQRVDRDGVTCLIDAAQAAGVEHFIYTSFTMDNDFPLRNAKRAVEGHLKDSGLVYTILRLSYTMDFWLSPAVGFDYANAKAQIYGSGENPISWVAFQDVAQFAVQSLENPAAHNATFELGGPEALSPLEVVRIFETVGGQPFEVQHVPEEALAEQQKAATDPMEQSFAALTRWYAKGDTVDMAETLKTFPVQLTSVRGYAQSLLAAS
jgi:NADH dehydrogenase